MALYVAAVHPHAAGAEGEGGHDDEGGHQEGGGVAVASTKVGEEVGGSTDGVHHAFLVGERVDDFLWDDGVGTVGYRDCGVGFRLDDVQRIWIVVDDDTWTWPIRSAWIGNV